MLIAPLATAFARHTSTRKTIVVGIIFEVAAPIAASFATKHRVANGIAAAGSGIGGLIFSLSIQEIITIMGVEWAFRTVAIRVGVVNSICTLLIRDRNKIINPNKRAFDYRLFKRGNFYWPVGMTKQQGSISTAMLNPGMAFGRPLAGLSSDYFGRINISGNMTLLSALNCFFIWIFPKTFAVALVFSLVSGAVCGVFWTTISPVVVEVVGIEELPRALSLTWLWITLPTTFSKPIGLYLRRPGVHNEYLYPQIFSGVMYLAATGCIGRSSDERERQKLYAKMEGRRKGLEVC
ncbi:MFS general substrate transporter [Choiromyces venosus 120613-1]|uniref:MFS general substrate transporter n=1 Tax=Choiromyces venosus 120613-1 TaxID=1336337 RepID=A0A3N4JJY6_9PEZI|nr:MFS general substrate transporter [Choiromyces venosus 120613-1]